MGFIGPVGSKINTDENVVTVSNTDDINEKIFKVGIGHPDYTNSNECKILMNLSEDEAYDIKERLMLIENENLSQGR